MKRKLALAISLLFLSSPAFAPPFIITDVLATGVTQCGVFVDTNPKRLIPVTASGATLAGSICKLDLFDFTVGAHTVTMTAITTNDPVWGSVESAPSLPLAFTKPSTVLPAVPTGLRLTP